jgi:hypothetical protein
MGDAVAATAMYASSVEPVQVWRCWLLVVVLGDDRRSFAARSPA